MLSICNTDAVMYVLHHCYHDQNCFLFYLVGSFPFLVSAFVEHTSSPYKVLHLVLARDSHRFHTSHILQIFLFIFFNLLLDTVATLVLLVFVVLYLSFALLPLGPCMTRMNEAEREEKNRFVLKKSKLEIKQYYMIKN